MSALRWEHTITEIGGSFGGLSGEFPIEIGIYFDLLKY